MSLYTLGMSLLDTPIIDREEPPTREWSKYQKTIFSHCTNGQDNLIVQAVAGSGKTTTIVEATKHTPGSSLFLAFNKSIAEEVRKRTTCDTKTFNALGNSLWRLRVPKAKLDAQKLNRLLDELVTDKLVAAELRKEYGYDIRRAVGLAKNTAVGIHQPAETQDFIDLVDVYLDVPLEALLEVAQAAEILFTDSCRDRLSFDFDDQLYIPLLEGWKFPSYNNVFVDECQDLSPIQHEMLNSMSSQCSRIIAVGDRCQAIYGFRGSLHDSMDQLKRQFSMYELPLSISYRCPKRIVQEAQLYSPHIQASPSAADGEVVYTKEDDPALFTSEMVLCRNNAPLVGAILRHLRARRPCRVMSSFLDQIQSFIGRFKCDDSRQLAGKLHEWRDKERAAVAGKFNKLAALEDKYQTLLLLCQEYRTTQEILSAIQSLSSTTTGPLFATIHKAKGLEAQHVYILRPDLMPAPYASTPEQIQQEGNLTYVAITRSQDRLTWGQRRS